MTLRRAIYGSLLLILFSVLSTFGAGEEAGKGTFRFSAQLLPIEENRSVPNVVDAFDSLTDHGEWLGFWRNSQTPAVGGATSSHFQGIARSPRIGGAPILYLTHSGHSGDSEGNLFVVRMASRNRVGERLRSNRLEKDKKTNNTNPPVTDEIVASYTFDHGDVDYLHAGGIQMVGDILAVPLEQPNRDDLPEGKIVFFNCADPENPQLLSYQLIPKQDETLQDPNDMGHKVGVIGITKLPDGHFFLAATWGDGTQVKFYRSNFSSFFDDAGNQMPGFEFEYHSSIDMDRLGQLFLQGYWRFFTTSPQTLNFMNQEANDQGTKLYLVGSSNSSSTAPAFNGDDHMFLWEVTGWGPGEVADLEGVRGKIHKWLNSEGRLSPQEANFSAAGGAYVTPTGNLLYYGADYFFAQPAPGTDPNVERMAELRNVFVSHTETCGPQFRPNHLGGPYRVAEGSSLLIDGSIYVIEPWIQMFAKDSYQGASVMVDWADQGLDDYQDFPKLDGDDGGWVDDCYPKDGFNDCLSSFHWCGPEGSELQLYDDDHFKEGNKNYPKLTGDGRVHSDPSVGREDFDNEATSVKLVWDPPDETYQWSLEGSGGALSPGPNEESIVFTAGAGSSTNELHLTVWDETHSATIEVYNIPPTIDSIGISNSSPVEGEKSMLFGSWSDPGAMRASVSIDWGDGTPGEVDAKSSGSFSFFHAYGDDGTYTARVCVYDSEDATCESETITVIQGCVGDCNRDGTVRIDDLVRGVSRALGDLAFECASLDDDGDGHVTIDELISAVNNAIHGCS